jgi:hypothetical protein
MQVYVVADIVTEVNSTWSIVFAVPQKSYKYGGQAGCVLSIGCLHFD